MPSPNDFTQFFSHDSADLLSPGLFSYSVKSNLTGILFHEHLKTAAVASLVVAVIFPKIKHVLPALNFVEIVLNPSDLTNNVIYFRVSILLLKTNII